MDPYYWLRDDERTNPEVLAYLAAENAYREHALRAGKPFENALYEEMIARLKQDDASVPYLRRGYWYNTRFEPGKEHPIFARRKGSLEAAEEILLDVNESLRQGTITTGSMPHWKSPARFGLAGLLRGHRGPASIQSALQEFAQRRNSWRRDCRRRVRSRLGQR